MKSAPKIVAIGGGSGLATLLRGLKKYRADITAVVTMTDNGASSGRLSREMGMVPPGDVRKCLAAMADDEDLVTRLFEYRFKKGRGISGHSLGNLFLLALTEITGSFDSAVEASSKILAINGRVLPATFDHVHVVAELGNGQMALGEKDIPILGHRHGIRRIHLLPPDVTANHVAITAMQQADLIVVGPGSLLTSIVPNFLIPELKSAFEHSSARKLYVCNVSTERGETEGLGAQDHVSILREYVNGTRFDGMIVNSRSVMVSKKEGRLGSVRNITTDQTELSGMPVFLVDVIDEDRPLYHDSTKLSAAIAKIAAESFDLPLATL
jgi:uncharacterized cofD-like protein